MEINMDYKTKTHTDLAKQRVKGISAKSKWSNTKRKWKKQNPPTHEGYYTCYICHKSIPEEEMTLDHIIPRSHAPELRYVLSNLAPCCWLCNSEKGSKSLDKVKPINV